MYLATVDNGFSTVFGIFLLLHIVAVLVAFAPAFVTPMLKGAGDGVKATLAKNTQMIHGPALALAGIFGLALVGMSSHKAFSFKQAWVSSALGIWIVMLGVVFGLLLPAQKKAAAGDAAADKRVSMANGIMHLLLVVMLVFMIFKPGFPTT